MSFAGPPTPDARRVQQSSSEDLGAAQEAQLQNERDIHSWANQKYRRPDWSGWLHVAEGQ